MLVHEAVVRDRAITCEERDVVQHGINSDAVSLSLDGEWDQFERITLVMTNEGRSTPYTYSGEPIHIPADFMETPGSDIHLSVVGRIGQDVRVVTQRMAMPLRVVESGRVDGIYEPGDPELDEVQQAIDDANAAAKRADAAADRAESAATISMGNGAPSVRQNEGSIYIDADSGDLWKYE